MDVVREMLEANLVTVKREHRNNGRPD